MHFATANWSANGGSCATRFPPDWGWALEVLKDDVTGRFLPSTLFDYRCIWYLFARAR